MNAPFNIHIGVAAPFIRDNVDTDQIIPSREMKSVYKTGLKDGLFAGQRYLQDRVPNPDFILNQQGYEASSILLSGQNFGCGSSREHAVWALKEYGFRAVIAESFGEIFYNNCVRNGILPIQFSAENIAKLEKSVTIDLKRQSVNGIPFEIPEGDKAMLFEGLDPIAMTLQKQAEIDAFIVQDKIKRPWAY